MEPWIIPPPYFYYPTFPHPIKVESEHIQQSLSPVVDCEKEKVKKEETSNDAQK